jgi:Na+/H+ antiporter NhaC
LSFIPAKYLLIGIFLTAAFISTAIGTSMGTIATIAPIAVTLSNQGAFPASVAMATVIGGAMFGDNLSVISDTTIASVSSQEANLKEKIKLNASIALVASIITIAVLWQGYDINIEVKDKPFQFILVTPYLLLIAMAVFGVNVFKVLIIAIIYASAIGAYNSGYTLVNTAKDITDGFNSMYEILLLSLMVGGLSGLSGNSSKNLAKKLGEWISKKGSKKTAQFVMAKIVSIFDILLANNTVAIIFSGEIVRDIADKYKIPRHYSATWIDNFSCVFQGIIPYGAQVLLASSFAGISPLEISPHVYYCYILAMVSITLIFIKKHK